MSTSTSNKALLELDRVNLVFHPDVYRTASWRDAFTRLIRDPAGLLLTQRERLHVARDVSFKVGPGERVALIGRNGAGKTSLCRCIAGMYRPTTGAIRLGGEVRAIFDTGVGVQPELTGRENARLLMELMFPTDPNKDDLVEDALEFSELGKFVDVPYRLYSNGMQARLCLSVISCKPTDLLILDEVFDGADTFFREKIAERVHKMIRGSGAVMFVSHSEPQVEKVCSRVIVLDQGAVLFDGDVKEGLRFYRKMHAIETGVSVRKRRKARV